MRILLTFLAVALPSASIAANIVIPTPQPGVEVIDARRKILNLRVECLEAPLSCGVSDESIVESPEGAAGGETPAETIRPTTADDRVALSDPSAWEVASSTAAASLGYWSRVGLRSNRNACNMLMGWHAEYAAHEVYCKASPLLDFALAAGLDAASGDPIRGIPPRRRLEFGPIDLPARPISDVIPDASSFEERSAEPGVLLADSFDSTPIIGEAITSDSGLLTAANVIAHSMKLSWRRISRKTPCPPKFVRDVFAHGDGSLRISTCQGAGSGGGGSYATNFSPDFTQQFGPGDTFFLQFRIRFDCALIWEDCGPASPSYKAKRRKFLSRFTAGEMPGDVRIVGENPATFKSIKAVAATLTEDERAEIIAAARSGGSSKSDDAILRSYAKKTSRSLTSTLTIKADDAGTFDLSPGATLFFGDDPTGYVIQAATGVVNEAEVTVRPALKRATIGGEPVRLKLRYTASKVMIISTGDRFDPTGNPLSQWKYNRGDDCTRQQIVVQFGGTGKIHAFHRCRPTTLFTARGRLEDGSTKFGGSTVKDGQPGGDNQCLNVWRNSKGEYRKSRSASQDIPNPECARWESDEWMTIQAGVAIGPYEWKTGNPKRSRFKLWVAREGQPSRLIYDIAFDTPTGEHPLDRLGHVSLMQFYYQKSVREKHPTVARYFDELIIKKCPADAECVRIADPL